MRALAQMGRFFPGKYQMLFLDGCDTFAYADDTLAKRRALLNPDDPTGTKYLDTITNAMPAYFVNMPDATMAVIRALLEPESPRSYQEIFRQVSRDHVVVVSGEEDNEFQAGVTSVLPPAQSEDGFVAKAEAVQYSTDTLPAGTYVISMVPDLAFPGGDADLRVRVGAAPRTGAFDRCPSYVANSNERCKLTLAAPAKVYFSVTGDAAGIESHFAVRLFSSR